MSAPVTGERIITPDQFHVESVPCDGTTKPLPSCRALPLAVRPMMVPGPASVKRASCSSPSMTG